MGSNPISFFASFGGGCVCVLVLHIVGSYLCSCATHSGGSCLCSGDGRVCVLVLHIWGSNTTNMVYSRGHGLHL